MENFRMRKKEKLVDFKNVFIPLLVSYPFFLYIFIPPFDKILLPIHFVVFYLTILLGRFYGLLAALVLPILCNIMYNLPMTNILIPLVVELVGISLWSERIFIDSRKDIEGGFVAATLSVMFGRVSYAILTYILKGTFIGIRQEPGRFILKSFYYSLPGITIFILLGALLLPRVYRWYHTEETEEGAAV